MDTALSPLPSWPQAEQHLPQALVSGLSIGFFPCFRLSE